MEAIEKKFLHIEEMLARILDNQAVIMKALGCSATDEVVNIERLLPIALRGSKVRYDILQKAIEVGLFHVNDGRLEWRGGSKTLLTYLCGRVWSGDYVRCNNRIGTVSWIFGCFRFPGEHLESFLCVKNLRQLRSRLQGLEPPKGYKIVDNLFSNNKCL